MGQIRVIPTRERGSTPKNARIELYSDDNTVLVFSYREMGYLEARRGENRQGLTENALFRSAMVKLHDVEYELEKVRSLQPSEEKDSILARTLNEKRRIENELVSILKNLFASAESVNTDDN